MATPEEQKLAEREAAKVLLAKIEAWPEEQRHRFATYWDIPYTQLVQFLKVLSI